MFQTLAFENHFYLVVFNISVNVKDLDSINPVQLTLTEKNEIKNLGCATPNLVTSQSSSIK